MFMALFDIADKIADKLGGVNKSLSDAFNNNKFNKVDYNPNRRTYVLNDYSIVKKAAIRIYTTDNGTALLEANTKLNLVSRLSVQINPNRFDSQFSLPESNILNGARDSGTKANAMQYRHANTLGEADIQLIFDIYDEYLVRSGDGSGAGGILQGMSGGSFSLTNDNITALPRLIRYAQGCGETMETAQPCFIYFQWGEVEHFGVYKNISVNYYAFSSDGNPLKATADIEIDVPHIPEVVNNKYNWSSWIKSKTIGGPGLF